MLHAVSVGFTPTDMRVELRGGEEVPVFERCELLEVSVVPIPADPGAVRAHALSAAGQRAAAVAAARSSRHMKGIALALGLREDAGEGEIVARVAALSELQRLTAAGSPTEALGVATAWKSAAERVPKLEAELSAAHAAAEERERAGIIERLRADKKITPAMEAWAKGVDVAALRAFASAAAPIASLSAAPPEPKDEAGAGLARRWEDIPRMERHRLAMSDPATYRALYDDHMRRGGR
jgi:hypothetical protein